MHSSLWLTLRQKTLCLFNIIGLFSVLSVQGFLNFFVLRPHCENFFFATLFMDSLDVNDTCKCPIGPHKSQEAFLSVGKSYK